MHLNQNKDNNNHNQRSTKKNHGWANGQGELMCRCSVEINNKCKGNRKKKFPYYDI